MSKPSRDVWIVAAKRTPFGAFGGTLKDQSATDLAVAAAVAALEAGGISPGRIDQVIFGNVQQTSADAIYLARHVGLRSGVPVPVPALTVNRLCGSGFQAIISAAEQILLGEAGAVLCGGTESMSQAPHVVRGARWGLPLGRAGALGDTLWDALTDSYTGMAMAITAENLAHKYDISRAACDEYALRSQRSWAAAQEAGRFREEIVPLKVAGKKGTIEFAVDEHPRPQTTAEALAALPPVFKKDGVVTAGNASGICDGAAALVLASREVAEQNGWRPLGRIVGWGIAGCDPTIMGIGPVPAIRQLLRRTGHTLEDFALIEVNEAFAAQYLAVERELGLDRSRTNVDGGAIALGHPLGASGARITVHLLYELRRRGERFGLGSACIGGGQGIALAVEAL
ncbi:MAG: acetyl-CoA C-acetyltransferase [Myxococcales bacterium]|nr:acetyl-CoA C-acetyltransferase [Myxococcota bacterium]MDW8282541.1 acetyl-CoA C-acetyltransferase [Myxococcales bacterium]